MRETLGQADKRPIDMLQKGTTVGSVERDFINTLFDRFVEAERAFRQAQREAAEGHQEIEAAKVRLRLLQQLMALDGKRVDLPDGVDG